MNILFLDDSDHRIKAFKSVVKEAKIAQTAQRCIDLLSTQDTWNVIFLDHDLGGQIDVMSERDDTGMEVVRWIVTNQPQIRNIIVHTLNQSAGQRMVDKLKDAKYEAVYIPYETMIDNLENLYE